MAAPSLYSHFDSKHAIYDAMFADAWQEYEQVQIALDLPTDPREALQALAKSFFGFSTEDLPRHQLMDSRIIPDFAPSPDSYAPAVRVIQRLQGIFTSIFGSVRGEDIDLYAAIIGGLIEGQWANDPGGDRYQRLLGRAVDMFADEMGLPRTPGIPSNRFPKK